MSVIDSLEKKFLMLYGLRRNLQTPFKNNSTIPAIILQNEILRKFGVECNTQKIYKAKKRALTKMGIDHEACYKQLWKYRNLLQRVNPRTIVKIKVHRPYLSASP